MRAAAFANGNPAMGAEKNYQALLTASLTLFGFFLPWSTAGVSATLAWLFALSLLFVRRIADTKPWREPVLAIGLILFAWVALRTAISGEPRSASAINQYHELLMIPMLWALTRISSQRDALFRGMVAGCVCIAGAYWVGLGMPSIGWWLTLHRISAGFVLAVVAFLVYEEARQGRFSRGLSWALIAFFAATVLFAINGRTGIVALVLLAGFAAWRSSPPRYRVIATIALIAAGALLSFAAPATRSRMLEIAHGTPPSQEVADAELSSTMIRVQLLRTGAEVAREHFVVGTGWAGYSAAFAEAANRLNLPRGPWSKGENPHDEYLLQLGAGGVPALLLFVAWVITPLRAWVRSKSASPDAITLACVAFAFAVACLFNSLLKDFVEAHLYGSVLAWLLARRDGAG